MRVVAALGGNAVAPRGARLDAESQRANVARAARALAQLAPKHELVVSHGNGPQVGLLALRADAHGDATPLDVLGAESEGMIGYWIEQELANLLPDRDIATLLTRVEVDPADPAFAKPSKPIGPLYAEDEAKRIAAERGWQIAPETGGWRRVVPSPEPRRVLELRTIQLLVQLGVIVVCGGGGGIPVVKTPNGAYTGVEAVIDKDRSAALLAARLGADFLLLLTDVPCVYADWPTAGRAIRALPPRAVCDFSFEPGSMGPKVEAAHHFVVQTGGDAAIGALEDAAAVLAGRAGTRISAEVRRAQIDEAP